MNKKYVLFATVFLVLCTICVFALLPESVPPQNTEYQPLPLPLYFHSVAEFEAAERNAKSGADTYYYTPSDLPDHITFRQIAKRDNVYIAVEYSVDISEINTASLSHYGIERMSSLVCQLFLYENGSVALQSYTDRGFSPFEYHGRTLYRYDEYDSEYKDGKATTAKQLIGYSVVFLEDGHCIYMHLPAIDTFENMLKYTDLIKVNID